MVCLQLAFCSRVNSMCQTLTLCQALCFHTTLRFSELYSPRFHPALPLLCLTLCPFVSDLKCHRWVSFRFCSSSLQEFPLQPSPPPPPPDHSQNHSILGQQHPHLFREALSHRRGGGLEPPPLRSFFYIQGIHFYSPLTLQLSPVALPLRLCPFMPYTEA